VRLDHLLSKEHLAASDARRPDAISRAYVPRWRLMGGTLTIRPGSTPGLLVLLVRQGGTELHGVRGRPGTLLGPEGMGDHLSHP
jgi:hypothetical protein